jgi:hypothetical protein
MVADLLAASPSTRNCVRWRNIPRIDSLVAFSRTNNVSLIRALAEPIDSEQRRLWYVHHRVPSSIVEQALRTALQAATPASLPALANQLGYHADASLRHRFPELCRQITTRRRATLKVSRRRSHVRPVPRHRVERALAEALNKDGVTDLRTVAASVGLSSTRRFYKDFHNLRLAVVAKNREIRKQSVHVIANTAHLSSSSITNCKLSSGGSLNHLDIGGRQRKSRLIDF